MVEEKIISDRIRKKLEDVNVAAQIHLQSIQDHVNFNLQATMEHIAAVEEKIVSDRIRKKLEDVNVAAQIHLQPIQDHVNFNLQKAYFKCAYECFDRTQRQEAINNCVEHCSVPVLEANNLVETEMASFQERLQRSLMVCQDRYEASKLQQIRNVAANELESCVNEAIEEHVRNLPHIANRLKASLSFR